MKFLCLFALLLVGVTARPQFQNFGTGLSDSNGFPIFGGGSTTTPRPTAPSSTSPRYLSCFQTCPSTSEYNPICASDNVSYQNQGKLNCAVACGNNVVAVRRGTCSPL